MSDSLKPLKLSEIELARVWKALDATEINRLVELLPAEERGKLKAKANDLMTHSSDKKKKFYEERDFQDSVLGILIVASEGFKAALACFLVIFVPQNCDGIPNHPDITMQKDHACSDAENWANLKGLNLLAMLSNIICFFIVVGHYAAVWYREKFLIEYLDEDADISRVNLAIDLPRYPIIQIWFCFYNRLVSLWY